MKTKLLSGGFLLLLLLAAAQLLFHTQVQTDITAFMPVTEQPQQTWLRQQLQKGPAARLWILALAGADADALAESSRLLAAQATASPLVDQVWNGPSVLGERLRGRLFAYRYLLSDQMQPDSFSATGLHVLFNDLLALLRSPLSTFSKELAPRDPGAASLRVFGNLQPAAVELDLYHGHWLSSDHSRALLLLQSHAAGTDLDAQEVLRSQLYQWLESLRKMPRFAQLRLELAGVPVLSLQTRARIRDASRKLGLLASVFMLGFMYWVFRDLRKLAFTALPMFSGVLVGGALVSWWFGGIHGITLAFGVILLGVAVDYPVHVLAHQRRSESLQQGVARIRPTLLLGLFSTLLGFSALMWTDFGGLAQLGLFAVGGLAMAAWVSLVLLPKWMSSDLGGMRLWRWLPAPPGNSRRRLLWALMLLGGVLVVLPGHNWWSQDIRDLSPVPQRVREADQALRQMLGAADPGYVLLVQADSVQAVLEKQERLRPALDEALQRGDVQAVDYAAKVLPSARLQGLRQSWIPEAETVTSNLHQALQGLPFSAQTFQPFLDDVQQSRDLPPLRPDDLAGSALGVRFDNLLQTADGQVTGLVTLNGLRRPESLRKQLRLGQHKDIYLLDIPGETGRLINDFREAALYRLLAVLAVIALVLAVWLRDGWRWMQVMASLLLSLLVAVATVLLSGYALNLFHLVSLLLVAGIGLDYALFFSRRSVQAEDWRHTFQALLVCVVSTVAVFLLLALSAIPVLRAIGSTVASGVMAAFVLSWWFATPFETENNHTN